MTRPRSVLTALATLAGGTAIGPPGAIATLLARTERWTAAELERHQLLRLAELVEHARRSVPFYAGRLGSWPVEELTLERWREVPILTRQDVLQHATELRSSEIPREYRVVHEANSSGSTGRHVTVAIDAVSAALGQQLALRDHAWHRRDLTQKAAAIRALPGVSAPAGRREPRWSLHPGSGPLALLDVHTPVEVQLDWLCREAPAYLATYATNAAALVARSEATGVALPSLRELGTFGEVLPEGLREASRRVWGVPLVDAYSSVELGQIALQCPETERHHVQSELLLLEVLRADGSPCAPGETGRVVATTLHAFAMPLLRYELGDHVTLGEACRCGRGLPVLERILGRSRNMLRLASGDTLWPRYGSNVLGKLFPVEQFRLVQRSLHALTLELVASRPLSASDEQGLRELVLGTIGQPFSLELRYVDALPRSAGGKFEDFVCELDAQNSQ